MTFVQNVGPYSNTRDGDEEWGGAWTPKHYPNDAEGQSPKADNCHFKAYLSIKRLSS